MANSKPVLGMYDLPMWKSMKFGQLKIQCCDSCKQLRYPPASHCPKCLSEEATWKNIDGWGTILSWVIFHRQYFDDYPTPYNSIAVRLDEGPILVTQLRGPQPDGNWIGRRIKLEFDEQEGRAQHYARLLELTTSVAAS